MSVIRTKRINQFTVIPNQLINDTGLDGDALGLLVFLLSKPADWWVSVNSLAELKRFGSSGKVVSTLKRLRAEGYAKLIRMSTGHTEWIITDTRMEGHDPEKPHVENRQGPHSQKPHVENPNEENRNVLQRTEDNKKQIEQKTDGSLVADHTKAPDGQAGKPAKPDKHGPPDHIADPVTRALWGKSLPFDFTLPDNWIDAVVAKHGCSVDTAQSEAESFIDYWANGKGRKQTRLDWFKTWTVWCGKYYALTSSLPAVSRAAAPKPVNGSRTWEQMRTDNTRRAVDEFIHGQVGVTIDA